MNRLMQLKVALVLTGVLTLSACVMFNRIHEMVALVNGNGVAFTLPEPDFADKDARYLLSLIDVVTRDDCTKECVVWEMVRPLGGNVDLIEENFVKFPIQYGATLPNMQTRILKPRRKGKYRASAQLAVVRDGKIVDSKQVGVVFSIE